MAINRDKILRGAEKLVQKGKIEPAIREYEKLLNLNPNDVNTINRIGDLYNRIGQVDRAVELYEKIADSFATDGFINKAIAIYKKINRLAPDRVEAFERLADLYLQQGLIVEAKDQYSVLAEWYLKQGDLDNAVQIQRKLIQIDPENHISHLKLADLLFRKGDSEEAIEVYRRLGTMLLERGKIEEAERLFRHALEQNPPSGEFLLPMCEALVEAGNLSVAREFLVEARKRSPESSEIGILDLKVALAAGESRVAAERAEELLELHPGDTEVSGLAGRAFLGVGDLNRGRELLLPVAEKYLESDDRPGAKRVFKWLIKALPTDRDVLKLGIRVLSPTEDREMIFTLKAGLADSHFQGGETESARGIYADLIREDPGNQLFQERLRSLGVETAGMSADRPAVSDEAPEREAADDVVEIEIEEPGAAADAFDVPVGGAPEVAESDSEAEVVSGTPDFDPDERLAEANVFAKYGLIGKALNHLETIIGFFPDRDEVREQLVSLAVEAGRTDLVEREAVILAGRYRELGDTAGLERLERLIPGGLAGADEAVEPSEVAEGLPEIEVIEEVELPEFGQSMDFSEVPAEVEPGEVPAVEVSIDEPGDIEAIELEEVGIESFEPRTFSENEDGIEFEGAEESVGEPAVEPRPEVVAAAPSAPAPPRGALDILEDLEQSILGGARAAGDAPFDHRTEFPPEEIAVSEEIRQETEADAGTVDEPFGTVDAGTVTAESGAGNPPVVDLEQLDSFLEHSLYEDATRLLRRLETEYPDSPEVEKRRVDLKAKGFLMGDLPRAAEDSEDLFVDEEEAYVDLAAELEEEMAAEEAMVERAAGPGDGEVDLEDVFREFQKGVAEQLSEEDADTHFNLGIAYKEMGLLPEAIREFQVASKDPAFLVECCSMIGVCYIEQGLWDQAAGWYQRALEAPDLTPESIRALKYELANCLQGAGDFGGAARFFNEVQAEDPGFRDVGSRVESLSGHLAAN